MIRPRLIKTSRGWRQLIAVKLARGVVVTLSTGLLLIVLLSQVSSAEAALSPWWSATSGERPTSLPVKGTGEIVITAENLGDAGSSGAVRIKDQLPKGLTAIGIKGVAGGPGGFGRGPVSCEPSTLTCTYEKNEEGGAGSIPPFEQIEVRIAVQVSAKAKTGEVNTASVSGGGAASPSTSSHEVEIGTTQRFGIEEFSLIPEAEGGLINTQAASHPFQITSTVTLNTQTPDAEGNPRTVALPKDIIAELPPGFIGNPTPFAQCTDAQFGQDVKEPQREGNKELQPINACPADSAIGVASVTFNEPAVVHFGTVTAPLFNMTPRAGEPARFGFKAAGIVAAFLDTSIRSGGDYGVNVGSLNIPQVQWLTGVKLTFWGTPGAAEHNQQRGWDCLQELGPASSCPANSEGSPPPFLVMPSSCEAPFKASLQADSWSAPGKPSEVAATKSYTLPEAVDGCNKLPFSPEIRATPDGTAASTPTGLNVDVHVPQNAILNHESLAESAVRTITVALPQGVAVNPSGSNGLEACSEALAGFTGFSSELIPGTQAASFTPRLPEPLAPGVNFCPDASKIGTVDISSPLLPAGQHVKGSVYLATQDQNPFGSLIAMYIIAEDPISGTVVKLPGEVHLTESGQIISTFQNSPQLAFEDAELHFFGGERAPLATPSRCGPYTTTASFTPWSAGEAVNSQSTFEINAGPNASPCPGPSLPFSANLTAGMTNIQAGAFSTLTSTIGREDGNQDLGSVSLHMPPGLSGILAGVKLCPEAQANAGTCPPESQIGETTVSAGLGADPVSVTGGKVYITEKYKGAPFGLSIVNPVKAGPFDLENTSTNHPACDCVVVRATVQLDLTTAQLTVTTDPSGPYSIPHMIEGIPVQIKHVNVLITRPGFTFNPTNCSPLKITGSITSDEGASQALSVPFQATNCATLAFKPGFAVATAGKTSKANGASLSVKVTYPPNSQGTEANIAKVKVELPKSLPARLTTLQKACTEQVFDANPAGCPSASIVGHAIAHTPVLNNPLEGPAYFVSHGGAAFPELILVLQGEGITIDLAGETFINSKTDITSSTFKSVPDAPVSSFELTLPQGRFSALAANGDLCDQKLLMPTQMTGQNGAILNQATRITVEGCGKTLSVVSTKVNKKTLKLSVFAPEAGKVTASGKGVSSGSKTYSGVEAQTFTLTQKKAGKLKTKIKLTFTPSKGKKQSKTAKVTFKR